MKHKIQVPCKNIQILTPSWCFKTIILSKSIFFTFINSTNLSCVTKRHLETCGRRYSGYIRQRLNFLAIMEDDAFGEHPPNNETQRWQHHAVFHQGLGHWSEVEK